MRDENGTAYCPVNLWHSIGNVGFDEDILPIFAPHTGGCPWMDNLLDLTNWKQVKSRKEEIHKRVVILRNMPPAGISDEEIATVDAWLNEKCPKRRTKTYFDFFSKIDQLTEYAPYYDPDKSMMDTVIKFFDNRLTEGDKPQNIWWKIMRARGLSSEDAYRKSLQSKLGTSAISAAVLEVDAMMEEQIVEYFGTTNGTIDMHAYFDAVAFFARDEMPIDNDRMRLVLDTISDDMEQPVKDQILQYAGCYSRYHRMDSFQMWFNWSTHADFALQISGGADNDSGTRKLQLASGIFGSAIDALTRSRGYTKEEWRTSPHQAILELQDLVELWAIDADSCRSELYEIANGFILSQS